jgi:hypothetical protein
MERRPSLLRIGVDLGRVNLGQDVSPFDHSADVDRQALQLAGDLRIHLGMMERLDGHRLARRPLVDPQGACPQSCSVRRWEDPFHFSRHHLKLDHVGQALA